MKLRKISSILLSLAILSAIPLYQAFAKGVVNEPQYTYTEALCTKGRLEQKQLCQSLSAEALVYRLNKAFTNNAPDSTLYKTWVKKLVNDKANPLDLANQLATENPSTDTNTEQVSELYFNLQCKTASQIQASADQWAKQITAGKQNPAKIALHLAKKRISADCLKTSWQSFIDSTDTVDLKATEDSGSDTLQNVSLSCEVASGANSCTTTAPQYCQSSLVTQPAHGSSTISGGNLTYTRSGTSTTTETYAHERKNGSATAKCNVTITFAVSTSTLQDVTLSCEVASGANSCTTTAPQYCQSSLVTQPAHGSSTISGGNLTYTRSGTSTTTETYAHERKNGSATAKCNVTITFAVSTSTLQDVLIECTLTYNPNGFNQCVTPAPQYCQAGLVTQPAHGASTISGGNLIYQPTGSSTAEENYAHYRQNGSETAKCNVKIKFIAPDPDDPVDNGKKFHIAIIGAGYSESDPNWVSLASSAESRILNWNPAINAKASKIAFHRAADPSNLGCSGGDAYNQDPELRAINCDNHTFSTVESFITSRGIPADKVVMLWANGNSGVASDVGGKYSITGMMPAGYSDRMATVEHEFGHNMGLMDEYMYYNPPTSSNFVSRGQCEASPPGPWGNVSPASEWYSGCGYSNLWRPSANSIMRDQNTITTFNKVSIEVMKQHLAQYIN